MRTELEVPEILKVALQFIMLDWHNSIMISNFQLSFMLINQYIKSVVVYPN